MMNFVYVLDTGQLKCPDLYESWYRKMPEARQKKSMHLNLNVNE